MCFCFKDQKFQVRSLWFWDSHLFILSLTLESNFFYWLLICLIPVKSSFKNVQKRFHNTFFVIFMSNIVLNKTADVWRVRSQCHKKWEVDSISISISSVLFSAVNWIIYSNDVHLWTVGPWISSVNKRRVCQEFWRTAAVAVAGGYCVFITLSLVTA